jgi:GMP reductase
VLPWHTNSKSIRFGATMVMIGSLFAGHEESPGETKVEDGVVYKEYFFEFHRQQ